MEEQPRVAKLTKSACNGVRHEGPASGWLVGDRDAFGVEQRQHVLIIAGLVHDQEYFHLSILLE